MKPLLPFRWDILEIIIGGKSSIDSLNGFSVSTIEDSDKFIRSYGFDLENPIEAAECLGHFHEALNFVRRYFLFPENPDGLKLEIPRKILELTDVRDLFLMASLKLPGQSADTTGHLLKNWSCAILKVMHTIAHVDQDLRTPHFLEIQRQILDRFYRVIHRDPDGHLFLGEHFEDSSRVNLVAFETKPKKSRDSILLKLLHKPENVAEDIFDRIGIRFITDSKLDCLRVIQFLTDQRIVVPPNIKPSRSRNTLLDLAALKRSIHQVGSELSLSKLQELSEQSANGGEDALNPHTSSHYRSIQFTCRQLIKLRNPLYDDLKELKGLSKTNQLLEHSSKIVDRIDLKKVQKEIRFFYPYEVQVVDRASHEENERGRSAHSEYKRAQLQTAMKRVMATFMNESRI